MGGVSSGTGAQGTKDGPLGVGPMPVLSEPLGSSISDHGSAGMSRCRDRARAFGCPQEHRAAHLCPQICCLPTDSPARPQPDDMTASKKSIRRRPRQAPRKGLKVRRPDELLAIIPYLIGFHPDESIVAVFIQSGRVVLAARIDLPPESAGDELAAQIEYLAKRHGASTLALVAYSAASLPAHRLLTRLMDRLGKHKLADVLYVGHGRWWSLTCGKDCCPLNGTPFDLGSHPLSAAAVFAGLGARANRQELAAAVSGPPETELPRLQELAETLLIELENFDDPSAAAQLMASLVDTAVSGPDALNERHSLLLGLIVTDLRVRDLAWALISPEDAEEHVQLWGAVVSQVPPTLAAAPLCLLGLAAWVCGAGALLNCCCERLAQVDPDYSLGRLLCEISAQALPPSVWQQMGGELQAELRAELTSLAG
jgi:hypothetical protein